LLIFSLLAARDVLLFDEITLVGLITDWTYKLVEVILWVFWRETLFVGFITGFEALKEVTGWGFLPNMCLMARR
jgi:hypothetical protein